MVWWLRAPGDSGGEGRRGLDMCMGVAMQRGRRSPHLLDRSRTSCQWHSPELSGPAAQPYMTHGRLSHVQACNERSFSAQHN